MTPNEVPGESEQDSGMKANTGTGNEPKQPKSRGRLERSGMMIAWKQRCLADRRGLA
jgi:hypothetical protein